jgi:hypothetical protein
VTDFDTARRWWTDGERVVSAPADFPAALVDDVLALFASRDQTPDVTILAADIERTR